jgi:hypothetical protein
MKVEKTSRWTTVRLDLGFHWFLTLYSIDRDHGLDTGFFRVSVPEAGHKGLGFQLRTAREHVMGLSFYHVGKRSGDA